jgi:hypothetical protein
MQVQSANIPINISRVNYEEKPGNVSLFVTYGRKVALKHPLTYELTPWIDYLKVWREECH